MRPKPKASTPLEIAQLGSVIGRTFALIDVAEEQIAAAKRRHPAKATEIHALFPKLMPGVLVGYREGLYEHHCRELIERTISGEDLRPGTKAEVVAALSAQSLKAPLAGDFARLYEDLFADVFGSLPPTTAEEEEEEEEEEEVQPRTKWQRTESAERLAELRRVTRQEGRGT